MPLHARSRALEPVGSKLTDEEQWQLCHWVGQFRTPKEIAALVKERFGKELTRGSVHQYINGKRWQPLIDRCRQEWATGIMQVPIAHKRTRLEYLERLLLEALADTRLQPWRQRREALGILSAARLEMEEAKTNFTNVFMTQITNYSDEELLRRRDALITQLQHFRRGHGVRSQDASTGFTPLSGGQAGDTTGTSVSEIPEATSAPDAPAQDGGRDGGGLHQRPLGSADPTDSAHAIPPDPQPVLPVTESAHAECVP